MLVLTRFKKQKIQINNDIVLEVVEIRGDKIRLGITAPLDVRIQRAEAIEHKMVDDGPPHA